MGVGTQASTATDWAPTSTEPAATSGPGNSARPAPVPIAAISAIGIAAEPDAPVENIVEPADSPAANAVKLPSPLTPDATPMVVVRPLPSSTGHTATAGASMAATSSAWGGSGLGMSNTPTVREATKMAKSALVIAAPSPMTP